MKANEAMGGDTPERRRKKKKRKERKMMRKIPCPASSSSTTKRARNIVSRGRATSGPLRSYSFKGEMDSIGRWASIDRR